MNGPQKLLAWARSLWRLRGNVHDPAQGGTRYTLLWILLNFSPSKPHRALWSVRRTSSTVARMSSELGVERPPSLALSEAQVVERRVHFSEVERPCLVASTARHSTSTTPSPRKPRPDPDFKPKRKRSMSFSAGEYRFGKWRHKRARVLPSKFLLGGSITDPLNLRSLDKEEASQHQVVETPVGGASKRSAAVRVIIPPNINDPLNLDASSDNEDSLTDALQRQLKRRRRRKRKRRLSEPGEVTHEGEVREAPTAETSGLGVTGSPSRLSMVTLKPLTVNTELATPQGQAEGRRESVGGPPVTPTGVKTNSGGGGAGTMQRPASKKQRHKSDNKIVSPVIPQPGGERKRHPSHQRHHAERPHLSQQNLQPPKSYNPKSELFQFGNYNKYYGYRNPDQTPDPRLEHLKREWFEGREVLDIGCNIGHVALTVARDFHPKRVVGIDIDKKLVNIAEKNIKHYVHKGDAEEANFPKSMRLLYGPLRPPVKANGIRSFPHNIKFVHGNYVLESDELLETVRPEFDIVLCLSITKWIHLNWGDAGLKRFFRRIFHNLRPGGRLVLEPQAWPSYNKRRKLTKRIFENYKSIRLFPDKFNDFLLHEVGFSTSEKLVTPNHASRGFQRPIIIYTKAGGSSKSSPAGESSATTTTAATTTITTTKTGGKGASKAITEDDDDVFRETADCGTSLRAMNVDQNSPPSFSSVRETTERSTDKEGSVLQEKDVVGDSTISQTKHSQHKDSTSKLPARVPNCHQAASIRQVGEGRLRMEVGDEKDKKDIGPVCDTSVTREITVSTCGDITLAQSSHKHTPSNPERDGSSCVSSPIRESKLKNCSKNTALQGKNGELCTSDNKTRTERVNDTRGQGEGQRNSDRKNSDKCSDPLQLPVLSMPHKQDTENASHGNGGSPCKRKHLSCEEETEIHGEEPCKRTCVKDT